MKKSLLGGLSLRSLSLASSMSALAQTYNSPIPGVLPLSSEHAAHPGPQFNLSQHTGTDVIPYTNDYVAFGVPDPQKGQTMQVMTWEDGNKVFVSWDFFDNNPVTAPGNVPAINQRVPNAQGSSFFVVSPSTGEQTPDPDIVLAYSGTDLYANLVYINGDRTNYKVMRWNTSTRAFDDLTTPAVELGNPRYLHSYPNIDANSQGLVAVTWQQSVTDRVNITVASTSNYFPTYTFPQIITFGRALLAAGDITGNFRDCYTDKYQHNSGNTGVFVVNPPKGLFEQTLHPDVAISEGDEAEAIISSTFVRHFVSGKGLFNIYNKLAIVQTRYGQCDDGGKGEDPNPEPGQEPGNDPSSPGNPNNPNNLIARLRVYQQHEWAYSEGGTVGTPRIAAIGLPRNYADWGTDVEVVIDRTVGSCGPPQYAIWNFGKTRGMFRDTFSLVSPAGRGGGDTPNFIRSVEPAVSYSVVIPNRDIDKLGTTYIVDWTGGSSAEAGAYDKGSQNDVWAVTMAGGAHLGNGSSGPHAQPSGYNRVNKQGDGDQFAPSVAGRFLQGNLVGRFGNVSDEEMEKLLQIPGASPSVHLFFDATAKQLSYRRSGDFAGVGNAFHRPATPATGLLLQAYPNPSEGAVTVSLNLHSGEQVRRLLVIDNLGRAVAELPLPAKGSNNVEWKPAANLPAGVYTVRATTTERTASVGVVRK